MNDKFGDPVSVSFRMFPDIRKRISKVLRIDRGEKYSDESHFCRVAVMRLLRDEESNLLKVRR